MKNQYSDYSYKNSDNKYVAKEFKGLRVTKTSSTGGLKTNQIELSNDNADDLADLFGGSTTSKVVTATDALKKEVNLASLFGKKVDVLFGKDNKVAYIKASAEDVVAGIVEADDFDTTDSKVTIDGKDYTVKASAIIYMNGLHYVATVAPNPVKTALENLVAKIDGSATQVTAVLDSGSVKYMNVYDPDTLDSDDDVQFIVKEIKSDKVKDLDGNTVIDLNDITGNDDYVTIIKNGKPATAADIKVGDVVKYITGGGFYM